ncbi:MAG: KamA family radical SAM protein [Spirochaetia bacterium]|nr:KamA family radical SAM protein [Spirochaetia bacterium]
MTDRKEWNSWKWQFANRITTAEELDRVLHLSPSEKDNISCCLKNFRMAITPYYASLMDPEDPDCPIRRQAVPSILETVRGEFDLDDPLGEVRYNPVPYVVQRYPDRALLLVTLKCSMYCRHCTRRRVVGENEEFIIPQPALDVALDYIRRHTEIRDVLISGGDPFVLPTDRLEHIISSVRAIEHVEIIRIGTRVPVVMPMRIDKELTDMLRKYHPLWVNTHFNHPKELTPEAVRACEALADAGIPLGNQTVLLKGINDSTPVMKELLLKLVKARVRPYYIFQCDLSVGISHFRVPVQTGIDIMHDLIGNISGYAVPKYAVDAPGGGGKVPLNYNYIVSKDDRELTLETYTGRLYKYPVR